MENLETIFDRCDRDADHRVDLMELHYGLKPRSARRTSKAGSVGWQAWDAMGSEHIENLSVKLAFEKSADKSNQRLDDFVLLEPWKKSKAEMIPLEQQESCGQAILLAHPKVTIALTAAEESKTSGQISVGVLVEGNALFRHLDQDGNWSLSRIEFKACRDRIVKLDQNADQRIDIGELPTLLHVTVARGAVAHRSLQEYVAFVPESDDPNASREKLTPPQWFASMDRDGDRVLTRTEFLGEREAFDKLDSDENQRLSVEEALSSESE